MDAAAAVAGVGVVVHARRPERVWEHSTHLLRGRPSRPGGLVRVGAVRGGADPSAWLEMVHPDDLSIARASNEQLKSLGYSSCEYRVLRHDGTVRWVADRKRMIVDAHGAVTMIGGRVGVKRVNV